VARLGNAGGERLMDRAKALLALTLILAAAWLLVARLRSSRARGSRRSGEARLLRVCHGDAEQAERLIRGETTRSPGISRAEAAARAVERYRRDNG